MKKLLNLLGLFASVTTISSITVACDSFNPNINPNPTPTPPVTHDIAYYQKEITELTKQIIQVQTDIASFNSKDMKEQICGSNSMCQDLQQLIDASTAELKQYQAQVQDDQYQILVLQTNGNFNPEDKLEAIKFLQTELTLLTEKRNLMLKVPDYNKSDFDHIDKQILLINTELAKLIPPKELIHNVNNN